MKTHWNPEQYQSRHSYVYQFGEAVVDLLAPQAGERILDLGCGSGQLTSKIAREGTTVIGLDLSPDMIAQARANFAAIEFQQGDASNFHFDQPFDAIFSNAVLHWVKDQEGVARSAATALKPGGRFVAEMGGHGNVEAIKSTILEVLGPVSLPWTFPSIAESAAILERNGLEVQFATLFDRPTPVEGEDGMENWLAMYANSVVNPDAAKVIAAKLRSRLYRDGVWTMDYRRLRFVAVKQG
jgi:SAM-dependent methyltransferase